MTTTLASVHQLRTLLKMPSLDLEDPYALLILAQASTAVRDAAALEGVTAAPGWVTENPQAGQSVAPQSARDITLWVAIRAYTNPRNLARRTAGPISESYFENGIHGLDLTDGEKTRLRVLGGTTQRGGLWVQPIDTGPGEGLVTVPNAMVNGQPLYIGDSWQYPWNGPNEGAAPVEYDGPVGGV